MKKVLTLAMGLFLMVALTGCLKAHADLEVKSNNTISGTMTVGVAKSLAQLSGMTSKQMIDEAKEDADPRVKFEPYVDEEWLGYTVTFAEAEFEQFNDFTEDEGGAGLSREGDIFTLTMKGEEGMALEDEQELEDMGIDFNPDVRFAITFPGKVLDHNAGTVDGRTITLGFEDMAKDVVVKAEAEGANTVVETLSGAADEVSIPFYLIIVLLLGLGAIGAIIILVVRSSRRGSAATMTLPLHSDNFVETNEASELVETAPRPTVPPMEPAPMITPTEVEASPTQDDALPELPPVTEDPSRES